MAEESSLRQRKVAAEGSEEPPKSPPKIKITKADDDDAYSPWVDILRVLTFLFVASCGLSYVISGGETLFWGMKDKPDYMTLDWWREQWEGPPPPIYLTPDELKQYDGSDIEKPLYLALNGTVFDVSNGRQIYGPGGSYHFFAGVDAARAFVTGCFADDQTPDVRGVENMFLPIDDAEIDSHWTAEELEKLRAEEMQRAKDRIYGALKHWIDFFSNSKKYKKVGYVKREKDWLEKEPVRQLCAAALKMKKKRTIPQKDE